MEDYVRVKIIVVGDSGVGKSSLVHLLANHSEVPNPAWTVGCSIQVGLHSYRCDDASSLDRYQVNTDSENMFFLEFWDIGGYPAHKNTRYVFYQNIDGIILVHDLTNRKSESNLRRWFTEVTSSTELTGIGIDMNNRYQNDSSLLETTPAIVIGTKSDLCSGDLKKRGQFALDLGLPEMFLSCTDKRTLSAGTSSAVKLDRFYDKVIECKLRKTHSSSSRQTPPRFTSNSGATSRKVTQVTSSNWHHRD